VKANIALAEMRAAISASERGSESPVWTARVMANAGQQIPNVAGASIVTARLPPPACEVLDGLRHVHSDVGSDVPYVRRGHAGRGSGGRAASALG